MVSGAGAIQGSEAQVGVVRETVPFVRETLPFVSVALALGWVPTPTYPPSHEHVCEPRVRVDAGRVPCPCASHVV